MTNRLGIILLICAMAVVWATAGAEPAPTKAADAKAATAQCQPEPDCPPCPEGATVEDCLKKCPELAKKCKGSKEDCKAVIAKCSQTKTAAKENAKASKCPTNTACASKKPTH
ncbi:MAG: hypothetical protein QNK37_38700 [Acidobacteriota bacterium]|nr:hypothetical protein [Acidobacteriota bacterium]